MFSPISSPAALPSSPTAASHPEYRVRVAAVRGRARRRAKRGPSRSTRSVDWAPSGIAQVRIQLFSIGSYKLNWCPLDSKKKDQIHSLQITLIAAFPGTAARVPGRSTWVEVPSDSSEKEKISSQNGANKVKTLSMPSTKKLMSLLRILTGRSTIGHISGNASGRYRQKINELISLLRIPTGRPTIGRISGFAR